MNIYLFQFPAQLKKVILSLLLSLTVGICFGLGFLYYTTNYSPERAIERFNGSEVTNQSDILENYPKPISEIFITTHNHIIAFTLIFVVVSIIFYFTSILKNGWKTFLLVEPFVSIVVSFSSLWLMRFLNPNFVYLMALSSTLIYISYFLMVGLIIYEIIFIKTK